jgi:hypothetical protein
MAAPSRSAASPYDSGMGQPSRPEPEFTGHFKLVPEKAETGDRDWENGLAAAFELGWGYSLQDENYLDFETDDDGGLSVQGRHVAAQFPPEGVWASVLPLTEGLAACLYAFLKASRMLLVLADGSATLSAASSSQDRVVVSSADDLYQHLASYSEEPWRPSGDMP